MNKQPLVISSLVGLLMTASVAHAKIDTAPVQIKSTGDWILETIAQLPQPTIHIAATQR